MGAGCRAGAQVPRRAGRTGQRQQRTDACAARYVELDPTRPRLQPVPAPQEPATGGDQAERCAAGPGGGAESLCSGIAHYLDDPRSSSSSVKKEAIGESAMNVEHEVNLLVEEIHRLGSRNADGKLSVKFGVLFQDDRCANLFEALVGTLKAAKRRKIVTYAGELLLQGVHDDVDIVLLQD